MDHFRTAAWQTRAKAAGVSRGDHGWLSIPAETLPAGCPAQRLTGTAVCQIGASEMADSLWASSEEQAWIRLIQVIEEAMNNYKFWFGHH